ncbi:MAG: imidazole glycerol phosphate synthase subunit HisH, partial [Bacteroidetes bacterium CG02_land_8_20_14_3_00_31_25]
MVIVNYNIGNISSIANMLQKIGHKATVTNNPDTIANANKIILSGVGAFNNGMLQLSNLNLLEVLNEKVLHDKVPV